MAVVTVAVYPIDERGADEGVAEGSSFQDLLFCHQTLPRPLITN